MKAILKQYRQSPRKVRLVADRVRGKGVEQAIAELDFLGKRAALPIKKLLQSAVVNASNNFGIHKERLFVSQIKVDEGKTLKRYRPRARGRASLIHKRTSHISIELGEQASKTPAKAAQAAEATSSRSSKESVKGKPARMSAQTSAKKATGKKA
ncbi:MAG: 50S ribosomal protein L22 [Candidatus Yonathbacteria bacterium CG_4_10_14_3_um_filter_47_65]|uniref:Large ribosomal subunit protein uL22 n=2 Tax=Parcubacteria group TaxID=1794811 RepID=A0A2M8D9R4_9BACT|nr:MAG: 50S ribosomal protein L22 [Candidatus Nomurabacteria bacterium CG1_02_47_685]PIP03206.1 MAG: 50S ribosomal protein L22 [Candidatus Yonathbacteria bacterium CG23_combo_of_CG06-09_8_20_14_all_46_18]PIQ31908.1 MAG: 50S ribosomal protein L22 [Candidatus Yonathbacteria bacterium CG17_big_fil_post_rev_8_21_14_2_50_46_19]PIX56330.1 MAG: 50S ribosomal protein L22 [Candidatus Yonathbacteria bacterium CG_4_10_14_3_um_filter_47_65]PIY57478.1 MAG: 50S ribosomal protein L22 [Candidatus Yonathbacteri